MKLEHEAQSEVKVEEELELELELEVEVDSALELEVELQPNMIHLLCANFRASAQEIEVFQLPAVNFVHLELNWELEWRPGVKLEQQLELELKPESALESDVELQPSMIHSLRGNFWGSAPSCCLSL